MLSAGERPQITMKLPAGVFSAPVESGAELFADEQVGEQIYQNGLESSFGAKAFGKSTSIEGDENILYSADAGLCAIYSQAEGQRLLIQGVHGDVVSGFVGLSRFCASASETSMPHLKAVETVNDIAIDACLGSEDILSPRASMQIAQVPYHDIYTFELALLHAQGMLRAGGDDKIQIEFAKQIPMLRNEAYARIMPELKDRDQLDEALTFIDRNYSSQSPIGNDLRKIAHGSIAQLDVTESRNNLYAAMYGAAGFQRDPLKILEALENLCASFERARQLQVPVELGNNADLLWLARTFKSQEAFQLIDQYFASNPEKNIGVETVASLGN